MPAEGHPSPAMGSTLLDKSIYVEPVTYALRIFLTANLGGKNFFSFLTEH